LSSQVPRELRLADAVIDEMVEHCLEGRPNEACGLIASKNSEVVQVIRMRNAAQSPVRYALEPTEQFMAYRRLEEEGLDLAGVFHSHTHTEAYPSPTDVRLASEDVPYLIVSLADDPPTVRAFRIVKENMWDEEGEVQEVPVNRLG
jgi:[CysO sulfur-carrier protein]-S-L-cysteine hydrolase